VFFFSDHYRDKPIFTSYVTIYVLKSFPSEIFICEDPQEKFEFNKFLPVQKIYYFFERDFLSNDIQSKNRQHCGSPNILRTIKNAVFTGNLTFKPLFVSLLSYELNNLYFDNEGHLFESTVRFDSFIEQMSHDDINIVIMNNCQLKIMLSFNTNSQIINISHNNWKAFTNSPVHHIPRNVWYRLLHKNYPLEPICTETS
jgi:hypothetical protein